MTLSIRNLDAPLGAEVSGIDLSKPVALGDVETIEDVWRERLVVVFHGQKLSDPQLLAFSRNFGSTGAESLRRAVQQGTPRAECHLERPRKRQANRKSRRR